MKNILIACLFLFSALGFSQSKSENVKEIISLSGLSFMSTDMKSQFLNQFKKAYPKIKDSFWKKMEAEINTNSLIEQTATLFEKFYTEEEIKELLLFYKSPLGKKMISNMPLIVQESQAIGQKWGFEIAKKITDQLEKEGFTQSPPPPSN